MNYNNGDYVIIKVNQHDEIINNDKENYKFITVIKYGNNNFNLFVLPPKIKFGYNANNADITNYGLNSKYLKNKCLVESRGNNDTIFKKSCEELFCKFCGVTFFNLEKNENFVCWNCTINE